MNYAEIAKDYSIKFDFYFLALIFTLLGLSIQTAELTESWVSGIFEICGWFGFLVSGLIGLLRMERFPLLYENLHNQKAYYDRLADQDNIKYKAFIDKQQTSLQRRYFWQKWLFVFSLWFIMVARSIEPIQQVICKIA